MKRILTGVFAALLSAAAMAATLNPIQLLNPAGSTAGQVIQSTGTSTPPAWSSITLSGLGAVAANTVVANVTASTAAPTAFAMPSCGGSNNALRWLPGSGFACASNIALLTGATFTGAVSIGYSGAALTLNDTSGAGFSQLNYAKSGSLYWAWANNSSSNAFSLNRFNAGTFTDSPISVSPSTGVVTMSDGITNSPISGSTGSFTTLSTSGTATVAGLSTGGASISGGSINGATIGGTTPGSGAFTTLAASSTVSGAGFSNYLASPPAIGGTTPGAGSFTTLATSGLISPASTIGIKGTATNDSPAAGSVGEYISSTVLVGSAVSLTLNTPANVTSISLTAGDWLIWGNVVTNPAGTTAQANTIAAISSTSATLPTAPGGGAWAAAPYQTGAAGLFVALPVGAVRVKLTTTTTYYLVVQSNFSVSTNSAYGFLGATRLR